MKKRVGMHKLERNQAITDIVIMGLSDTELAKRKIADSNSIDDEMLLTAQAINYLFMRRVSSEYLDKIEQLETRIPLLFLDYNNLERLVYYIISDRTKWYLQIYTVEEMPKIVDVDRLIKVIERGKQQYQKDWSDEDFESLVQKFVDSYIPDMSHNVKKLFSI